MLRINKKVEYALMALKFIWENKAPGDVTSAREICEKFGSPFDTTAKVMQSMNQAGILTSIKGVKGGYTLETSLENITYMQLVRIIEKKEAHSICHGEQGTCELYHSCNIVAPIEKLNHTLNHYLESLTIGQLFKMSFPEITGTLKQTKAKTTEALQV
jgi:Rrf2 family protein